MKRFIVSTLLALCCITQSMRADVIAGPITNSANGHIYYLLGQTNWVSSEQQAKSLGGHLATIDDSAEQVWVYTTFSAYNGIYRALWIGLHEVNGSFRWSSGVPLTYTNWNVGEPNGPQNTSRAVHLWSPNLATPGKWNDAGELDTIVGIPPNTAPLHGVVEVDPIQAQIQVSQVAISWNAALDIHYQVQYSSALTSNTWVNVGPSVVGTGGNSTLFDSVNGQPKKFYRVIAIP